MADKINPELPPPEASTTGFLSWLLVMGFVAVLSGLYHTSWAHPSYTGPVVDVDIGI